MSSIHIVNIVINIKKRRCDKTLKTSVVEAEKRTNRASIDSEVFELATRHHSARLFRNRLCGNNKEAATYVTASLHYPI